MKEFFFRVYMVSYEHLRKICVPFKLWYGEHEQLVFAISDLGLNFGLYASFNTLERPKPLKTG